jgi:hypothetical protein
VAVSLAVGHPPFEKSHVPLKSKTMLALAVSGQSATVEMPKANAAEPSNLRFNKADIFVP